MPGEASGVNTIHHDIFYRHSWDRIVNLRVHPLTQVAMYFDWKPLASARFFSASSSGGVDVDGHPDAVSSNFVPWTVTRTASGGLSLLYDLPPSPRYQSKELFYRDDSSYNDQVPSNTDYSDEDDAAIGDVGLKLKNLSDSNLDPILLAFHASPLCSNVGDAPTGEADRAAFDHPPSVTIDPQAELPVAVRDLSVFGDHVDLALSWSSIRAATGYRVYRSPAADTPHLQWELVQQVIANYYRDAGAGAPSENAFCCIVAFNDSGDGGW